MDWTIVIIAAAFLLVILLVRRAAFISAEVASKYLAEGALVIDVRSAEEFNAGHLPNAVNIPLDNLQKHLPRHLKDKQRVLLLHCLSGTRSGIAKRELNRMGYPNAFNLGSFARARRITSGARNG